MNIARHLLLPALLLSALSATARGQIDDELSIPQDRWDASRYCGPVRPDTPVDPTPAYRFEHAFLDAKLAGDGLTGWIHGAVPQYEQYVYTYRKEDPTDPMAFFKAEQFSLIPASDAVAAALMTLHRHDKIRLHGSVFQNGAPLTHLWVTAIDVLDRYPLSTDNEYIFDMSRLEGRTSFHVFGQIHATLNSPEFGRALVLDHDGAILPLAVPPVHDQAAAPVYKGDIVDIAVRVVPHPHGPPHLEVDAETPTAITVIDPLLNCHGLEKTVEGYLVKFDRSPAISTDVYAVRVVDSNGIGRNFTLFPDTQDDDEFARLFFALSAKAKAAWDSAPEEPVVVRNYHAKEGVHVRVHGHLNVVSTEQANAQVYVRSENDLTLTVEP